MKQKAFWTLALLCTIAQGFGAVQITEVSTEDQLTGAIADDANIQLTADIQLSSYLYIAHSSVTIDLNGHKLSRSLSDYSIHGSVIEVDRVGTLILKSSAEGGSIEGGKAIFGGGIKVFTGGSLSVDGVKFTNNCASDHGGAIFVQSGTNVSFNNTKFINNSANDHAGAIWNNGTLTATDCTFTGNTASDVGAIYNSVTVDGAGRALLTNCTFTGNVGTAGAGALANALGNSEMTIVGCTITENSADTYGAGIWNGGTLNMKGKVRVQNNTNVGGVPSNVYLKNDKVITVIGSLTGSSIGVEMESTSGEFTRDYSNSNYLHGNGTLFTADRSSIVRVGKMGEELCLIAMVSGSIPFIERSWDDTNMKVVNTEKSLTTHIASDDTPTSEVQYKEVTNAPASSPDEWFGMGGYSDDVPEFYVVRENVKRQTIVVQGKNVHLVLCDGATLTLTGGLKLEEDNKLYIHCQSYGSNMGRLMVTNKYDNAAGIGSAQHNGKAITVGELVIYGGHVEATGGKYGAGIGSCARVRDGKGDLCNQVTVYGGYVKAQGGTYGAGIGGGAGYEEIGVSGGDFILYDGTVIAQGGEYASGVGGGGSYGFPAASGNGGCGKRMVVYGGTLTATGGYHGAGIGSGYNPDIELNSGGIVIIKGGKVTANGGDGATGIGGGYSGGGGVVEISGGTVTANAGAEAAGIGGGASAPGGEVTISGGTVYAYGKGTGAGIGGGGFGNGYGDGKNGTGGNVTITGGTVIAKAGKQGGTGNRAIGPGQKCDIYGSLTIGDQMMVGAGNNGSVERIYNADERVNACWFRSYAEVSPCTHPSGFTYTINGEVTHTTHCKHCSLSEKADHFNSDGTGTCICGYKDGEGYCTITIATSRDGSSYEGVGVMANVGNNMPYTLPVCSSIPEGYDFAGWAVNPTNHNGILPNGDEELKQAGENITVTGDVSIFARYKDITISLADNSDNAEMLYNYDGKKATSVTLTDRTLYKDGGWNTLCLPFSLSADQIAASDLVGADIRTLVSSSFDELNGTLTLTFTPAEGEGAVTAIEAGKPYIIKWTGGSDIVGPTFSGVTISNATTPIETKYVDFVGTLSPIDIFTEYKTNLYLAADNKLYYPSGEGMTSFPINSCRAFFQLKEGLTAGEPVTTEGQPIKAFVLNFGEETGIEEVNGYGLWVNGYGAVLCPLDGRRLGTYPATPGLYIYNCRKVLIK